MVRSPNADLAVHMYEQLRQAAGWTKTDAWKGIARLLLSCEVWEPSQKQWVPFHDVVVFRERNDFKKDANGNPNAVVRRAENLTRYLAGTLGVPRTQLCGHIATYWRNPQVANAQPHNLVGNAFRSLVAHSLECYGSPNIAYEEEVDPHNLFPGQSFSTRSKNPRIDIVGTKKGVVVALLSVRWRFRHDRVDVVDEAIQYSTAARRVNPRARFYAVLGEFAAARLEKVLDHCPPKHPNPSITAAIHFQPNLVTQGLNENGRLAHLQSLEDLIDATYTW